MISKKNFFSFAILYDVTSQTINNETNFKKKGKRKILFTSEELHSFILKLPSINGVGFIITVQLKCQAVVPFGGPQK
jgi:hypothetical protein